MVTTGVALLLICAGLVFFQVLSFRKEMAEHLTTYANIAGNNVSAALDFNDTQAASDALSGLKAEPEIVGARVYGRNGSVFAEYKRAGAGNDLQLPEKIRKEGYTFGNGNLSVFQPIKSGNEVIGTIFIQCDTQELKTQLEQYLGIIAGSFGITLGISLLLSNRLQRWLSKPLLHLATVAQTVAQRRDYTLRAKKVGDDEVGQLIDRFNEMLAEIQEHEQKMELKVQERTQAMRREVEERKRTEIALQESQALYHSLVEQLPVGIFRKDTEGRYVLVNSWFCKLQGKPAEHVLGKTPLEVSSSGIEDESGLRNLRLGASHHEQILETGKRIEVEEQHPDAAGIMRNFHVIKTPVFNADGKVVGSQGILMDVTERKVAEDELNRERELLRALMDNSDDCIYFKDRESRFLRCSAQMGKLFNVQRIEELIGKRDSDFFAGEHAEEALCDEQTIMRTGEALVGKVEKETWPDGHVTWALTSKMPLRNKAGEIVGTFGISKDITELKRAQEEAAREQARFKFIFDSVPIGISLANYGNDHSLQERLINDSHLKICGLTREQDRDPTIYGRISHPDDRVRQNQLMRHVEEKKTNGYSIEKRYLRADGKITWVMFSFQRRYAADGSYEDLCTAVDITENKQAQEERERLNRQLLDASRQAGMAEVATSVLHNVGNVLNSVNVSGSLIAEKVRNSKVSNITKAVALIRQQEADLGNFFANDPKGKQLPGYLEGLATHLAQEQQEILKEVGGLVANIVHIKEIVSMQQSYAKSSGIVEELKMTELMDDALRMNEGAMNRHNVTVVRDYSNVPPILTEKHKVLQILINLIRNAKYACDDSGRNDKQITLRVANGDGRVKLSVVDNGVGILPENLTRIFNHGFTTRKEGHGFGLHSGANAAKELGGALRAFSDGHNHGATFTLELPVNRPSKSL